MKIVDDIGDDGIDNSVDNPNTLLGGFFEDGMRWPDYRKMWTDDCVEIDKIREFVVSNKIKVFGEYMEERHLLLDDGERWCFSMRAWGDLMAAVWSTEEDQDYNYMDYYMSLSGNRENNVPQGG